MQFLIVVVYRNIGGDTDPGAVSDVAECSRQDLRQVRTMPSALVGHAEVSRLGQGTRSK